MNGKHMELKRIPAKKQVPLFMKEKIHKKKNHCVGRFTSVGTVNF